MDFNGKTAIVTGAGSGMGLLFAKEFVKLGGNALLCDISRDALDSALAEINKTHSEHAEISVCDVRKYSDVTASCELAVEKFGSIDIVVNLAGGAETRICRAEGEFPDIPIEVYDWGIDVNLKGQLYFCHAAMKQMREQKSGVIVNIGSITGEEGCSSNIAYAASKSAAMNGLTKSVANYGSRYGVRCVCVSPGPVLTRTAMAAMQTALGRAAEPIEIIDLIFYLISDKASFITGINVLADGGRNILNRGG